MADALSRITIHSIETLSEDIYAVLKLEQKNDEDVLDFIKKHPNKTEIRNDIYSETSRDLPRPIIPESLKRKVFNLIHNLSHPGRNDPTSTISKIRVAQHQERCYAMVQRMFTLPTIHS